MFIAQYPPSCIRQLCYHGRPSILQQPQISHARTETSGKVPCFQDGYWSGLSRKGETDAEEHIILGTSLTCRRLFS